MCHNDNRVAFALSVGAVIVELNVDDVVDAEVVEYFTQIFVSCPPGHIADEHTVAAYFAVARERRFVACSEDKRLYFGDGGVVKCTMNSNALTLRWR